MSDNTATIPKPKVGDPPTGAKLDGSVTELLNLLDGGPDVAPVQPKGASGVVPDTSPPKKPGKAQTEYDGELCLAMPKLDRARGLPEPGKSVAGSALKAMEAAFDIAVDVDDGDLETASKSLAKAVTESENAIKAFEKDFLSRQKKAVADLGETPKRINKLAVPPAAVIAALKTATDAQAAAKKEAEAAQPDWPKANTALKDFNKAIGELEPACLTAAMDTAAAFAVRYKDKDKDKPAGKDIIKKYTDYTAAAKTLDGLIKSGDGLGALETCAAADTALKAFETAASPSATQKEQKVDAAFTTLKDISDRALAKKSTREKAELALDLCANGVPTDKKQLDQLVRLYNKSPPDKKFLKQREQQRKAIADEVSKMPEIKNLYDKKGNLDKNAWNQLIANPDAVRTLLENVSTAQAKALGMPPIKVNKKPDPPVGRSPSGGLQFGGYNPKTNEINLNLHADCLKPVEEALGTILHETFHAHQDVMVKKLKSGEIGPDDPDYPTALMYMVNDIPVGYLFSSKVGHKAYASQPTEIDAEGQGNLAARDVLKQTKKAAKSKK